MTSEGQAVDTEAAEDSFLDTLKARPHCSPSPRAWYPRIKRADALDTLAFLDQEWEPHADRYEEELREYRLFSLLLSGGPIVAPGMFVLGVLSSLLPSSWEPGTPWVNGFLSMALYVATRGLVGITPFGSRFKFFRRAFFVDRRTREFEPAETNQILVACMNEAGRGARRLFRYIQGGRWTWTSPPVVADRALMLTYPIINVDLHSAQHKLSAEDFLVAYPRFFRDVAVLVAIGREDLIPGLRGKYSLIPAVTVSLPSEVPERDARFLDPMRDHSRWQVFKDYLLPLASWFSLALAIAVLVVDRLG